MVVATFGSMFFFLLEQILYITFQMSHIELGSTNDFRHLAFFTIIGTFLEPLNTTSVIKVAFLIYESHV